MKFNIRLNYSHQEDEKESTGGEAEICLLYTSDAADD